jgi:hypothetical protein
MIQMGTGELDQDLAQDLARARASHPADAAAKLCRAH